MHVIKMTRDIQKQLMNPVAEIKSLPSPDHF